MVYLFVIGKVFGEYCYSLGDKIKFLFYDFKVKFSYNYYFYDIKVYMVYMKYKIGKFVNLVRFIF